MASKDEPFCNCDLDLFRRAFSLSFSIFLIVIFFITSYKLSL